jgi:hypothetical protein
MPTTTAANRAAKQQTSAPLPTQRPTRRAYIFTHSTLGLVLKVPYDARLVEILKKAIPSDGRSWMPDKKVWTIHPDWMGRLVAILVELHYEVLTDKENER